MRTDYSHEDAETRERRRIAEEKRVITEKLILSVLHSKVALARLGSLADKSIAKL